MAKKTLNAVDVKDLTEEQIDKQEHLNEEVAAMLIPKYTCENAFDTITTRPKENLIDLMHWAKDQFKSELTNKTNLSCFIHNKIVIDGAFTTFAKEMGVKIECIFRDSVASWKTENNFEHFMAQGIFKISYGKLDFLHCALFHKGNQNEDEVSFFIVVADDCLRKYIELRNMFEKWLSDRDRDHLEIHVVAGEGIPYKRDMLWEDLFLPENLKAEIRKSVEGFLASRDFYAKNRLPWKRGILLYGTPGCGKSSLIKTIISNYNFKPVTIQSGSQTNDDTITEAFAYAQEQEPALLYLEDLDTLLNQNVSLSHFLQKMDGVSSQNGIMVIATANNIGLLKESVTDRPSRFDRKWEIPLPDAEMSKKYLKKWFGKLLTEKAYNKIVLDTVEKNFSYAYLKELYITSMFNAMAENRTEPSLVDVNAATQQLLNDKETAKNGFEPSNYEAIGINNE